MRIVGALLVALAAACPALATAAPKSKPAAEQAKPAAAGTPRAVYAAMPEADRMAIQSDLIWTGDYNGIVSADFGENSVAAVKAFQKRNGGKETGILNPDERSKLAESAKSKQGRAGWRIVDDRATGARLGVPGKLVPQASPAPNGSRWQSPHGEVQVETFRFAGAGTTLASILERIKKDAPSRKSDYQVIKPDFFVISGLQGGVKKFYTRAQIKDNDVRGVTVLYDLAMENQVDPIVVAISNAFAGFPPAQAAAAPAARRPVEYGTGIVVSKAGHIVTDRQVVDGCRFVVIPGLGNAERVADDKAADLALLHVFGAQDLVPVAIAGESGSSTDATLIGIADPQAQNGGSEVSTLRARVLASNGPSRPIEPAPAAGFAGSAAIDGDAKFLGMVGLRVQSGTATQAAMVPADAIRAFLDAQSVAPASGRTSVADAKASVVRVICVRK
ncbi:MAG TPA: serine protease [Xanthobacteraceae bacterium]